MIKNSIFYSRKLFLRVALITITIITIIFTILTYIGYIHFKEFVVDNLTKKANEISNTITILVKNSSEQSNSRYNIKKIVESFSKNFNMEYIEVQLDGDKSTIFIGDYGKFHQMFETNTTSYDLDKFKVDGVHYMHLVQHLEIQNQTKPGRLTIVYNLEPYYEKAKKLWLYSFIAYLLFIIIVPINILLGQHRVFKPMVKILSYFLPDPRVEKNEKLNGNNLDHLINYLDDNKDEIANSKKFLEEIKRRSPGGVIVVSQTEGLIFSNENWNIMDPDGLLLNKIVQLIGSDIENEFYFEDNDLFLHIKRSTLTEIRSDYSLLIIDDVSQLKRSEEDLIESKHKIEAIMRSITDIIIIMNQEGVYEEILTAHDRLLYRDRGDLLNRSIDDVLPPKVSKLFKINFEKSLRKKRSTTVEYQLDIDGEEKWFEATITPLEIFNKDNEQLLLIAIRDISDKKHLEESLRESNKYLESQVDQTVNELISTESRYKQIIELANIIIIKIDKNLKLSYFNNYAKEIFAILDSDLGKLSINREQFLGSNDINAITNQLNQLFSNRGVSYSFETTHSSCSSKRYILWNCVSYLSEGNSKIVLVGTDITSNKMMQLKLERSKEDAVKSKQEIEKASKIKSEFLATMSHEIRTPLNAVLGYADILNESITDQRSAKYLDSIKKSSTTLLSIINNILNYYKLDSGKNEINLDSVNLKDLVNEIKTLFYLEAKKKGNRIKVEFSKNLPPFLLLDIDKLRQILNNIIGNANKFTDNGEIKISVNVNRVKIRIFNLFIKISDTGVGISKHKVSQIFDPFVQERSDITRDFEGTGLGLTITKKLVEIMGGSVDVESLEGKGTTFTISLYNTRKINRENRGIEDSNFIIVAEMVEKRVVDKLRDYGLSPYLFSLDFEFDQLQQPTKRIELLIDTNFIKDKDDKLQLLLAKYFGNIEKIYYYNSDIERQSDSVEFFRDTLAIELIEKIFNRKFMVDSLDLSRLGTIEQVEEQFYPLYNSNNLTKFKHLVEIIAANVETDDERNYLNGLNKALESFNIIELKTSFDLLKRYIKKR